MAIHIRRREFISLLGSTAAMWPRLARAQRPGRIPKVGVLWHAANIEEETPYYQSLVEGFRKLGYVDGQNITLEHRFPNEVPEVFDKMAAELVSLKCDVLVGAGAAGPHLKKATKTIPIVFMFVPDPIGAGLVENYCTTWWECYGIVEFFRPAKCEAVAVSQRDCPDGYARWIAHQPKYQNIEPVCSRGNRGRDQARRRYPKFRGALAQRLRARI